jgi:hypothetical protein
MVAFATDAEGADADPPHTFLRIVPVPTERLMRRPPVAPARVIVNVLSVAVPTLGHTATATDSTTGPTPLAFGENDSVRHAPPKLLKSADVDPTTHVLPPSAEPLPRKYWTVIGVVAGSDNVTGNNSVRTAPAAATTDASPTDTVGTLVAAGVAV